MPRLARNPLTVHCPLHCVVPRVQYLANKYPGKLAVVNDMGGDVVKEPVVHTLRKFKKVCAYVQCERATA